MRRTVRERLRKSAFGLTLIAGFALAPLPPVGPLWAREPAPAALEHPREPATPEAGEDAAPTGAVEAGVRAIITRHPPAETAPPAEAEPPQPLAQPLPAAEAAPGERSPLAEPVRIAPPELPEVTVDLTFPAPERPVDIPPPDLPAVIIEIPLAPPSAAPTQDTANSETAEKDAARHAAALSATLAELRKLGLPTDLAEALGDRARASAPMLRAELRAGLAAAFAGAEQHALPGARYRMLAGARIEDPALIDLAPAAAALLYARDARGGRIQPRRLSALITPKLALPDADAVLDGLVNAQDGKAFLESFNPPHAGYRALKAKLAELRQAAAAETKEKTVPPLPTLQRGEALRPGMSDGRVAAIRAHLIGLGPETATDAETYDETLAEAVKAAQKRLGARPTGIITGATLAALEAQARQSGLAGEIRRVIANMERWRWLPPALGDDYVMVNIPAFEGTLVRGGAIAHQMRVVVGKPETPTPIFSDAMQFLIVNPSWNVPPSIASKEMLPSLQRNPYALKAKGLDVVMNGRVVDPASIDWSRGRPAGVSFRQPPGERNALGHIKFMFPNEHAVYLHDTPSRALFGNPRRAYSHGCVRVDGPFALAEQVLNGSFSQAQLRSMIGRGERMVRLPEPLPVHLVYFTAAVDETGAVTQREDLYGIDRKVAAALGIP